MSSNRPEGVKRYALDVAASADALPGLYEIEFEFAGQAEIHYRVIVVPTDTTPTMGAVTAVAAGERHSLALSANGSVWAWGSNAFGQLGDGSRERRLVPVRVAGLPQPAIAIAAGAEHSLAVLQDNTVWGWGRTADRRLRIRLEGSPPAQAAPVMISGPPEFAVGLAAGDGHAMALQGSGGVVAWGRTSSGQTAMQPATGGPVGNLPFRATQVEAAYDVSYAVLADRSLWAWGDGSFGQLGPTASGPRGFARPVETVSAVDAVRAGMSHTLVLSDGAVIAFGGNRYSQLGDGSREPQIAQPVFVPRLLTVREIAAGRDHSLALQADGRVLQWGLSDLGQAGPIPGGPSMGASHQLLPEVVAGLPSAAAIDAGGRHSIAVTAAGQSAYAWGDNRSGQLGDGTASASRAVIAPVYGSGAGSATQHALTLLANGEGTIRAEAGGHTIVAGGDASRGLSYAVAHDDIVTLTASAATGGVFLGWSGQTTGSNAVIQVTMDRSRVCIARFGRAPVPDFEASSGSRVTLRAVGDVDLDGCIVLWEWDIGNDGQIDATGPQHGFDRPEMATDVRLRVTDNDGLIGEIVQTVAGSSGGGTGNNGLIADFYTLPAQPISLFPTTFSGLTSSSPNGPLTNWQWDFTNDGTFDASGSEVMFTYAAPGTYAVRLVVTDQNGQQASTVRNVVVTAG
ncbi:MAG: PKD domain-containing protein [bacterium]|nr:PKD domain-containing protein [bacterium]